MLAVLLVARYVEVVELGAVVAHQAGHLLKVLGLDLDDRRRAVAMRLLTTGDERLCEETADRFAPVKTQVAFPLAEAEQLVGPRRSQPLKRDRQRVGVELLANGVGDVAAASDPRRRHLHGRNAFARRRAQPPVGAPCHRLNRGLASERAPPAVRERPSAQIDHVGFP